MTVKCTKCNGEGTYPVYGWYGEKKCIHCNGKGFNTYK